MAASNSEGRFYFRLVAGVISAITIMYLAKIWFIDPRHAKVALETTYSSPAADDGAPVVDKTSEEETVISWRDASKYYGQYVTVGGTIVVTHNSGKACFLNFHPNYKRYFTAVIFASAFKQFPSSPENYYLNKRVLVTGVVKEYNGKPEIILDSPGQIKILN